LQSRGYGMSGAYDDGSVKHADQGRRYDDKKKSDAVQYLDEDASGAFRGGQTRRYDDDRKGDGVQYLDDDPLVLEVPMFMIVM
jgi:hypothetical protein